ncbi:MAG: DNA-binding protein [Candidatus Nanohaloarchaea archaeon]
MVDDEELEKLKEERRQEIEGSEDREDAVEEQRQQFKEMAAKHLTKDARSRLGNIRAAKPELASSVEMQIAQLGRAGRVDKITDEQLKDILKEVQKSDEDTDIKFRR